MIILKNIYGILNLEKVGYSVREKENNIFIYVIFLGYCYYEEISRYWCSGIRRHHCEK